MQAHVQSQRIPNGLLKQMAVSSDSTTCGDPDAKVLQSQPPSTPCTGTRSHLNADLNVYI